MWRTRRNKTLPSWRRMRTFCQRCSHRHPCSQPSRAKVAACWWCLDWLVRNQIKSKVLEQLTSLKCMHRFGVGLKLIKKRLLLKVISWLTFKPTTSFNLAVSRTILASCSPAQSKSKSSTSQSSLATSTTSRKTNKSPKTQSLSDVAPNKST